MKRLPALFFLLPLAGLAGTTAHAATPPFASTAASDASIQQQMAELQARMGVLAERMAALSAKVGNDASASALRYLADSKRAMLGIATRDEGGRMTVVAVSPASPAERAGVQVDDVITAISAKSMTFHGPNHTADLANLRVDEPVELTVQRHGKTLHLTATPERFQDDDWQDLARAAREAERAARAQVNSPAFRARIQDEVDAATRAASLARREAIVARAGADQWQVLSPWWGLNLAPLNTDLGRYFGTDTGALVLSRDAARYPELQPGDVITSVAKRKVAAPQDAMRAFRDAPDAAPVTVQVRRHGKLLTLALKTPPRAMMLPPPPPPPAIPVAPPPPPMPNAPNPPAAPAAAPPPSTPAAIVSQDPV